MKAIFSFGEYIPLDMQFKLTKIFLEISLIFTFLLTLSLITSKLGPCFFIPSKSKLNLTNVVLPHPEFPIIKTF